jgi:hypothetical protein
MPVDINIKALIILFIEALWLFLCSPNRIAHRFALRGPDAIAAHDQSLSLLKQRPDFFVFFSN